MAEPITFSGAVAYIVTKGSASIAGLAGGLSVSFFWQPKKLHEHGKMAAGAIIGGISASGAFALGGIVSRLLGLDFAQSDVALGVGWLIGVTCVGFVAFAANFLEKRENKDLLEVVNELKGGAK